MSRPGAVVGDRVEIVLSAATDSWVVGTVQHTPQGEGDSWVIYEPAGHILHIQRFETMRVIGRLARALEEEGES
ncbi:hypothetical protein ES708_18117 [subsurface metagenome]